ncbi:hypothetical protein K469DRAFT_751575 [Zopfia rhizophila CBS 207.26]|uniref:Uncharacterized protein n=1 Tax=Zopfia rhizophila CBS 207.26 TaxID=1314779 RepID=A0A6A6DUA9_9PEZI|nr:hypothetical protein K469DRAFT_751575 [Zopfia rhizophila CBS 207.26]
MNATLDIPFTAFNASRNCTAFGLWHDEALLRKETTVTLANFLRSAITAEVPGSVSNGDLMVWWENFRTNIAETQIDGLVRETTFVCMKEVCETMSWEGNSDISGIGMLIGYVIEAILVALYTIAWFLRERRKLGVDPKAQLQNNHISHTYTSFHGSASVFLTTAMVFSSAVQLAAIVSTVRAAAIQRSDWIEITTSGDVVMFTLLVVVVLSIQVNASQPKIRRRKFRTLCSVLAALAFWVQLVAYVSNYGSILQKIFPTREFVDSAEPEDMVRLCIQIRGTIVFSSTVVLWTWGAVVLSGWVVWPLVSRYPRKPLVPGLRTKKHKLLDGFELCLFAGALTGMIAIFILYIAHRIIYHGFGQAKNEGAWTFGQIIALFTWVPVVFELTYIYRYGLKQGLEGRINSPWTVDVLEEYIQDVEDVEDKPVSDRDSLPPGSAI